jgi:hypothetical protein
MKTISLKIDDVVFGQTEAILLEKKKPRNRYINDALIYYNRMQKRQMLEDILKKASKDCEKNSLEILKEFEMVDNYDF